MGTPLVAGDRVLQITTTTGTGTYQLGAAAAVTYRTLAQAGIATGDRVMFFVQDDPVNPTLWEECEGIFTAGSPDTLTRATVLGGSNGTSPVNWASGTKYVVVTAFARRLVYLDTDGQLPVSIMAAGLATTAPAVKRFVSRAAFNTSFGLSTTAVDFTSITVPKGTQKLSLSANARASNQGAANSMILAFGIRNAAGNADVAGGYIAVSTTVANNYHNLGGTVTVDLGGPLPEARNVVFRAFIDGGSAQLANLYSDVDATLA